jgi:hypothetical protein
VLAYGKWFSPDTTASSTTKTGRHDIAEILRKVALNIKNQSINQPPNLNNFNIVLNICCPVLLLFTCRTKMSASSDIHIYI